MYVRLGLLTTGTGLQGKMEGLNKLCLVILRILNNVLVSLAITHQ